MCILSEIGTFFKTTRVNVNICKLVFLDIYSHREIYVHGETMWEKFTPTCYTIQRIVLRAGGVCASDHRKFIT